MACIFFKPKSHFYANRKIHRNKSFTIIEFPSFDAIVSHGTHSRITVNKSRTQ
jgi:hypothetical protein